MEDTPNIQQIKAHPYVLPLAQHQKCPPPLPPEVVGNHKHHKVNKILNSRRRGRYGIEYLINWKGYRPKDCTWAIPSDIKADNTIKELHEKYPDWPKPYIKKAADIRFADIEEQPHFNRVTFPADFFNPYIPGVYGPATVTVPEPLTTGIELSIPDELTCIPEAWRQKHSIYTN